MKKIYSMKNVNFFFGIKKRDTNFVFHLFSQAKLPTRKMRSEDEADNDRDRFSNAETDSLDDVDDDDEAHAGEYDLETAAARHEPIDFAVATEAEDHVTENVELEKRAN